MTEGGNVAAVSGRDAVVVYLPPDTDNDGIPDSWTQQYFGHPTGQDNDLSQADDDPDGDGLTNLQEYILGTNPKVHDTGMLQVTAGKNAGGQATVQFKTVLNRFYRVFYASDLSGFWSQAGNAIPGTGSPITWTDDGTQTGGSPVGASARFYRIEIGLK